MVVETIRTAANKVAKCKKNCHTHNEDISSVKYRVQSIIAEDPDIQDETC